MEPKRYAMVRDNVVYNVCLWNGDVNTWQPPNDGTIMIANDWVGVGDWWEPEEQTFYRALPINTATQNEAEITE